MTLKSRPKDKVSFKKQREVCAKIPRALGRIGNELTCVWSSNILMHLLSSPHPHQPWEVSRTEWVRVPFHREDLSPRSHIWRCQSRTWTWVQAHRNPSPRFLRALCKVGQWADGRVSCGCRVCKNDTTVSLEEGWTQNPDGRTLWGLSRKTPWESH